MPQPVSLASMVASVQSRANIENFSGLVTVPNIRDFLNESIQELYDLLVDARGMEYYRNEFQITTIPNQAAYNLPTDFMELLSVDIFLALNQIISARPYMEAERNMFKTYPGWVWPLPVYWRLLGANSPSQAASLPSSQINFIPAPSAAVQVTLNYVPCFTKFATDGSQDDNVFDGVNGWESYAIWAATAMAQEKMEQDSSFSLAQCAKLKGRIQGLADNRSAGDPERIHDVSPNIDGWTRW